MRGLQSVYKTVKRILCLKMKLRIVFKAMERQAILFFKLILLVGHSPAENCDRASPARLREGNLGQSGVFNWLGILHVQLHELIATSGIVLIKIKYALVNADDVARIPQRIFKSKSRAMFLAAQDTPWYAKPVSYITHPEYEYSMHNSIAIIELDLNGLKKFPLTPICLPNVKTLNTSRYFYLIGFTHENETLEKVLYKIQYLDKQICEEFHNEEELSSPKTPFEYLCGYSPNSATRCVWDNGMSLVSNSFGYLNLIGFSVHGSGCAVPTRFIDLFPYFHWIQSITDNFDSDELDSKSTRRDIPNMPIHELYRKNDSRRSEDSSHEYEAYPAEYNNLKFYLIEPSYQDKLTYLIIPFQNEFEYYYKSCEMPTAQIYHESFELLKPKDNKRGYATYKLSLYDQFYSRCVCVRLTVNCYKRSYAMLSFREEINFPENTQMDPVPQEIFRDLPLPEIPHEPRDRIKDLVKPAFLEANDVLKKSVSHYDLYIKFEFNEWAKLDFEMLAEPPVTTTTTEGPTTKYRRPTTTGPPGTARRRGKTRHRGVKTKSKSSWGVDNWADNMLREAELSVREEEVPDRWSAARGGAPPRAAVMAVCLIASLSRAIFRFLH